VKSDYKFQLQYFFILKKFFNAPLLRITSLFAVNYTNFVNCPIFVIIYLQTLL